MENLQASCTLTHRWTQCGSWLTPETSSAACRSSNCW